MFQLQLCRDLVLKAEETKSIDGTSPEGVFVPGVTTSTITIENASGVLLTLEPNWSQAVFNHDFHAWLINLVKRINEFLAQFLAEVEGPATQADFEAALTAKLSFDPATNQVVIK
jgi:hypothetical protein